MEYQIEDANQPEKAVIGAILAHPQKVYEAMTLLTVSEFTFAHSRIFEACVEIANQGGLPETLAVCDHLANRGLLEKIGGLAYLIECERYEAMGLAEMCRRVREHAHRRRLLRLCELVTKGLREGKPVGECLEEVESGLLSVHANNIQSDIFHVKDFALAVVDDLYRVKRRGSDLIGLTTGIQPLDDATGGIRAGELWIIGALPGRGKTALGLQIAAANADRDAATLIFSLEMAKELVMQRILAAKSRVKAGRIRNPNFLSDADLRNLQETAASCAAWPLYVDESSQLTVDELRARAKLFVRRHGVKLIIADYLRLIRAGGRELREQVGNAADCLRRIAKEENVAVVGLSQLKRPENINDRPNMLGLKESGDIEAHAHVCLLLYQPVNENGEFTHEDEIIVGKQRNGPLGTEKVRFDHNTLTFKSRTNLPEVSA